MPDPPNPRPKKSLSRSVGEFFGHIIKAVKTDPAKPDADRTVVRKTVEEEQQGDMILRRTTIEEVELRPPSPPSPAAPPQPPET